MGTEQEDQKERTFTEELELAASDVVDTVKHLIQQGNVRRIILRKANDEVLLEIPLTAGVAVGGALAFFAPILAAVGALAALLTSVKIQVVRVKDAGDD